jgi:HIRAN domain
MSATEALDELSTSIVLEGAAPDAVKRDRYGRPSLINPGDTKRTSFLRPSSVGGVIKDNYTISAWQQRMAIKGITMSPELLATVAQLDVKADRERLNQIADKARELAGGNEASDFGTAVHAYLEGRLDPSWGPEVARCGEAAKAALVAAGLTIVAETQELFVVNDDLGCAGSTDGIVRDASGECFIFDFKTGSLSDADDKDDTKTPCAPAYKVADWVVQLAIYANANACYDFVADVRTELPAAYQAVSKDTAKVVFIDRDTCAVRIIDVDIKSGLTAAKLAITVNAWQKVKTRELAKVSYAAEGVAPSLASALEESIETTWAGITPIQDLRARIARMSKDKIERFKAEWTGPRISDAALGKIGMTVAQLAEAKAIVAGLECNATTGDIVEGEGFTTRVSGVSFVDGYPENVFEINRQLASGEVAGRLERVLDNPHDANAVAVVVNDKRVGWVPSGGAQHVAPLLDQGRSFDVVVQQVLISPDNPNRPGLAIRSKLVATPTAAPVGPWLEREVAKRYREWLVGRVETLRTLPNGLTALSQCWPSFLPTFKQSKKHTDEELEEIERALTAAEAMVEAPFPAEKPGYELPDTLKLDAPAKPRATAPTPPSEGAPVPQEDMDFIIEKIKPNAALYDRAAVWVREANEHGHTFNLRQATQRRFHIGRIILQVEQLGEDITRAYLAHVLDTDAALMPMIPFGVALGSLNHLEAERVMSLMDSDTPVTFSDAGHPVVVEARQTA